MAKNKFNKTFQSQAEYDRHYALDRKKKLENVDIKYTKEDLEKVKKLAEKAGLKLRPYVREASLKGKIFVKNIPIANAKLVGEMNKIGVNLNQITKAIHNLKHLSPDQVELALKVYEKQLQEHHNKVNDLLNLYYGDNRYIKR
jgi:hypothetical protein